MAHSDYKRICFVFNFEDEGDVTSHCGKDEILIGSGVSFLIRKSFAIDINGAYIIPGVMDFQIDDWEIYIDHSCAFWINETKFGVAYIAYANESEEGFNFAEQENKIFALIKKHFKNITGNSQEFLITCKVKEAFFNC